MHFEYFYNKRKGSHSSFLTSTAVGGRRLKISLKVTYPFEERRLRQIFPYNVSTVSSEKFKYGE